MNDIKERQKSYEDAYDYHVIRRVPIIIKIEARNFKRITADLKKPFSPEITDAMAHALVHVAMEVSGAIFGYQKDDEINIVIRQDDDELWLQNKIQKISSTAASLTTLAFNKFTQALDLDGQELSSDAVFSAHTFAVPSIGEAINYLVSKQADCILDAVHTAASYELSDKYTPKEVYHMLQKKNSKDKQRLLLQECEINFDDYYSIPFRRGIAAYKAPSLKDNRFKWIIDLETPLFISNKDWLENIFRSGKDIFRARDFINEK